MADATDETITVHYRSPALAPEAVRLVVTVPTFRRPEQIVATLASLAAQNGVEDFAVIVMDNDAEGLEGARAASAWLETSALKGLVIVAHQRGNCHAYNAGWSTALKVFPAFTHLAVIDDDEIADPDWLARLVATADATGADFVGGPQVPVFDDPALARWRAHPVFTPHYAETGPVPILYSSGNVLIARRVLETMPRPFLDPGFNFIGGGDSDFYRRSRAAGFTFAWCAAAPVMETVPSRRTEFSWINARSLRNGAISAIIERRERPGIASRLRIVAKSLALLSVSPLRGLLMARRTGLPASALYHAQVAVGRLMAEIGLVNEQYRNPEAN